MSAVLKRSPLELVNWSRFDLMFKYLYAKAKLNEYKTSYFSKMYAHHIAIWNNFREYNNPEKTGREIFFKDFDDLIVSINENGMSADLSTIPITQDNVILNGAHRLAACLASDKEAYCQLGVDRVDGQANCSWIFFEGRNRFGSLDARYADRAALELTKLVPSTFCIVIFPSAVAFNKMQEIEAVLAQYGGYQYRKELALNANGGLGLMRELYYRESWAEARNGGGYISKANKCYPDTAQNLPTYVYFQPLSSVDEAVEIKTKIRRLFDLEKHSVHINDNHQECVRIAQTILNPHSEDVLNNSNHQTISQFETLLDEYRQLIPTGKAEHYCITAGASLSAYGLKECKDIDYLHGKKELISNNPLIQSHNRYGIGRYELDYDDIIYNPENHFYRHGLKFASLSVVAALKRKRGEPKDFRDLELISNVL